MANILLLINFVWFDERKQTELWCVSTESVSLGSLQHTTPNLLLQAVEKLDVRRAPGSSQRREEPAAALAVCAGSPPSPNMQIKKVFQAGLYHATHHATSVSFTTPPPICLTPWRWVDKHI